MLLNFGEEDRPSTRQVEYCLVFVDRLLLGTGLRRWGELRGPRPQCKVEALGNRLINIHKKLSCQIFKFADLPCLAASSSSCVLKKNKVWNTRNPRYKSTFVYDAKSAHLSR